MTNLGCTQRLPLIGFLSNKYIPSIELGFLACISSRITTVIQVVRYYQINYSWFNLSCLKFHRISAYTLDMHGLVFKTSIWLLVGSTRLLPFFFFFFCFCLLLLLLFFNFTRRKQKKNKTKIKQRGKKKNSINRYSKRKKEKNPFPPPSPLLLYKKNGGRSSSLFLFLFSNMEMMEKKKSKSTGVFFFKKKKNLPIIKINDRNESIGISW